MEMLINAVAGGLIGVAGLLGYQWFTSPNKSRAFRQAIRAVNKLAGEDDAVEVAKRLAEEAALKEQLKDAVAKL